MAKKAQSVSKNLGQLNSELLDSPEYKLHQQLESIKTPLYIFDKNFTELKTLLEFFINNPESEPLTFSRNRDRLDELLLDILRRLHNFVAASLTLIDHTRNLYQKLYSDSDKFADYQIRIRDEFEIDPLAQFVKGLRKYFQHYSTPDIVIEESFPQNADGEQILKKKVLIFTKDLTTFDGWNATAKKYLNKPNIDLLEVVDTYRIKVMNFYRWFIDRQNEIHRDELHRLKVKHNEFIQAFLEARIDSKLKKQSLEGNFEDEIFSGKITSKEFENLMSFDAPPNVKADYAIQLLSGHFPVSKSLRQKIIKLYKQEHKQV
jgi:hypothetical protein